MKIKIGIVGCGTIGLEVAKAVEGRLKEKAVLCAVCDVDQIKIDFFLSRITTRPDICSLKELVKKSDFVVEAASAAISAEVAKAALCAKKDVLVMSVGGLLKDASVFDVAKKGKARIYVPSGALAGLDAIKAARIGRINKVTLTTKKSPRSLEGAPYLVNNNIDLSAIKEEKVIFDGTALEAVKSFPKNVNVAATLSLVCSVGAYCNTPLHIKIIAVPGLKTNIHEVEVEGEFGKLFTRTENLPSPENPKTSYLAALSAIATLENALDNVKVGT